MSQNITTTIRGTKLTIECDLAAPTTPSKSGKSQIIATTSGNTKIPTPTGVVTLGLNLYR